VKRVFDLFVCILLVPVVAPVIGIVAFSIWLTMGQPVFFTQARGGYRGMRFDLWKFRSMTNERDTSGALLPDEARITRLGRFLRSTSLDELPSFWNLLKGDISFVGPRPFIADYLALYTAEQMRRHDVRPGITGWAQIKGRNNLSWEEKFALDLWYVRNHTLWLDFRILLLTVWKVVRRDDINADSATTMPRFTGYRHPTTIHEKKL
jgi:sugar transferase EpsL